MAKKKEDLDSITIPSINVEPKRKSLISSLNKTLSSKLKDKATNMDIFTKFGSATEYISTGNYLLNALITGSIHKGLPNTRSLELAGKSGTGKTFVCLNMVNDAQTKGYHVYYIDTEGALDEEDLRNFGIDDEMITHIRTIDTYEGCIHFINNLIHQLKQPEYADEKVMLIIDSIGMLNTSIAKENALKGKYAEDMGKRAKIVRELFRNVTLDLSNLGIPFVFTNHTADSLNLFAIDKEVTAAGEGPTFAASFILLLGTQNYLKDETSEGKVKTGKLLRVKSHKNRKVVPMEIHIHLSYKKGMNPYVGLEPYIIDGWDKCGVDFGKIMDESEFNSTYKNGIPTNSKKEPLRVDSWDTPNGKYYCVLNKTSKTLAVKDTCDNVSKDFIFTDKVFTKGTLELLDVNVIQPMFKYSDADDTSSDIVGLVQAATSSESDVESDD